MRILQVICLCLSLPGILLTGCASKVSGRFDLQQRFATGVEIVQTTPGQK